jgi:hypothetical protein
MQTSLKLIDLDSNRVTPERGKKKQMRTLIKMASEEES